MNSDLPRRTLLVAGACGAITLRMATALAADDGEARALIEAAVNDIRGAINSGLSDEALLRRFERIFLDYADVQAMARSVLGPPARTASRQQLRAFTDAFSGYMARKYGRRFRDFKDAAIEVTEVRKMKRFHEVRAIARRGGKEPLEASFVVSGRSGKFRLIDIVFEGISLLKAERVEMQALLDRQGGDVDRLVAALNGSG